MGRNDLEDIAIMVGLGIVGVLTYQKFFPGKSAGEVFKELDTTVRGFLDTIKLPEFPALPTPFIPPAASAVQQIPQTPTEAPFVPDNDVGGVGDGPKLPTNTIKEDDAGGPKVKEPPVKPRGSGQLATNPDIKPDPSGVGALIAFAGDWDSNSKAVATTAAIDKQDCEMIIGVGDYSYTDQTASTWFNQNVGPKWKGKMKGCLGNHDVKQKSTFLTLFGQTSWNMGVKVAPTLTVVFIDTESGISAATLDSLTTSAKSQSKHVVYVFHKPYITSSNGHHGPGENKWSSIIDAAAKKHGVKLLIAGHNHLYEHFKCGEQHYVTSGAAGRKFYDGDCKACGTTKCVENTNGFLKVAAGNTLTCQFISNSGQTLDSFQIA